MPVYPGALMIDAGLGLLEFVLHELAGRLGE
jgi:hypothetical protein